MKSKKLLMGGGIGLVVVILGLYFFAGKWIPKTYTISGTVTRVHPETRQVSLEFRHPRKGTLKEITGELTSECSIHIDNTPAEISDLKVGDLAKVTGTWCKHTKELRPLAVNVTRTAIASSEN